MVMSGQTKPGWFWFWSIVADLATRWQAEVVPAAWSWATTKSAKPAQPIPPPGGHTGNNNRW